MASLTNVYVHSEVEQCHHVTKLPRSDDDDGGWVEWHYSVCASGSARLSSSALIGQPAYVGMPILRGAVSHSHRIIWHYCMYERFRANQGYDPTPLPLPSGHGQSMVSFKVTALGTLENKCELVIWLDPISLRFSSFLLRHTQPSHSTFKLYILGLRTKLSILRIFTTLVSSQTCWEPAGSRAVWYRVLRSLILPPLGLCHFAQQQQRALPPHLI